MKRIAWMLACLMLAQTLLSTACSETTVDEAANNVPAAESDALQPVPAESVALETEKTTADLIKEKYEGQNLGGYEYKVLAPAADSHFYHEVGAGINEVYAEEINGELINDAIWTRNGQAEGLLNIKITPIWNNDTTAIMNQIHTEVLAGSTDYDAVLGRMDYLGTNMTNGDLLNLMAISTMDVHGPSWDKNIVDTFTLYGDRLYFISGDINIFDDFAVEAIFFNKSILDENSIAYPYDLVREGKWTIERFYEITQTTQRDVNGDGEIDTTNDIVGHVEGNDHIKHWLYAMGEKSIRVNTDGEMDIMIQSESHINAIDTLFDYMVNRKMSLTGGASQFTTGHVVFMGAMLGVINSFREMEQNYGVLPMPKKDEAQERYGQYVSNGWTTAYAIPMTSKNVEQTGMILEVLNGFSTDTLRVALYDVMFAAKIVRDNESVDMLDIIFDSKAYDWAVDFTWGNGFMGLYNNLYSGGTNNYVSTAQRNVKVLKKTLEKMFSKLTEIDY